MRIFRDLNRRRLEDASDASSFSSAAPSGGFVVGSPERGGWRVGLVGVSRDLMMPCRGFLDGGSKAMRLRLNLASWHGHASANTLTSTVEMPDLLDW